jgi:hypothetical protein
VQQCISQCDQSYKGWKVGKLTKPEENKGSSLAAKFDTVKQAGQNKCLNSSDRLIGRKQIKKMLPNNM